MTTPSLTTPTSSALGDEKASATTSLKSEAVIDPSCLGMGDFMVYAWILTTASSRGLNVKLVPRRWVDLLNLFGCRNFYAPLRRPDSISEPDKGTHKASWLQHWYKEYVGEDLELSQFVRPQWTPAPIHEKAIEHLHDGRGSILIFPEISQPAWVCREWPISKYIQTAYQLRSMFNCRVICITRKLEPYSNAFPEFVYGLKTEELCSLIKRARGVLCNESGPAHIAGTLEVPTVVVAGPSLRRKFAAWLPSVSYISNEAMTCTGCDFKVDNGYRRWCDFGCQSLQTLNLTGVLEQAGKSFV